MLGIILFILKLIGILLLVVLGLIVLVLLLILFAPIKYKSNGRKYGENLDIHALITYLNPIVRAKVHYPDETVVQVKVLGIKVYPGKSKEDKDKSKEAVNSGKLDIKPEHEKKITEEGVGKHSETGTAEDAKICAEKDAAESSKVCAKKITDKSPGTTAPKETAYEKQKETSGESCKTESGTDSDKEIQKDSEEKAKGGALDTIGYYASVLTENKTLILDVLKTVLKALKTILPRKCYIKAVFGTGQADTTGFIYGAYCSIQEYLPGEIYLEPVWTESCVEGEYSVKGKVRLIHFAVAIVKLIADEKVRLLVKKLRRV